MDTLTHALSGALLARATMPGETNANTLPVGRRMFVGFVAAAFPDADIVTSYLSPLSYLYHHRGVTHSLLMIPLWAAVLALVFAAIWRWKPGWRAYFGIAALGVGAHIAGDLITSFGTMIFSPLTDARYGIGTTFIIDLWFSGIIVLALLAGAVWRQTRAPAVSGLVVLAAYVCFQWGLQQRAIDFGVEHARASGLEHARVTAQPRPVFPFNWTVVVDDGRGYRYAHVNLVREKARPAPTPETGFIARLDSAYRPLSDPVWLQAERFGSVADEVEFARDAFSQPEFRFFRWFAAYPALVGVEIGNPHQCAWFHDLRFVTPGREGTPFRYGMCREADGPWRPYQMRAAGAISPVY
ncbi:MAG: metal-dependent hydrolase [Burkholderiales bacterium]